MSTRTLSAFLLAASALVACGDSKPAPQAANAPVRLRLQLNWVPEPEFGGFYAARDGGAYRRRGLDVEIQGGGPGTPVVQMVASGSADYGVVGADDVVIARARKADLVAIFAAFQRSPQAVMVHASRGLASIGAAFASGTVALEPGLPAGAFLLARFGGKGARIVPYDNGVARFLGDPSYAQQCFVTSEPIAARQKGGDPATFLIADAGYDPYLAVVVTRGDRVARAREEISRFVDATREGWRAYLDDPAPTNATLAKLNPTMDARTLAEAAEAQKPFVAPPSASTPLGSMTKDRWATIAGQLRELGIVDAAPPAESLYVAP